MQWKDGYKLSKYMKYWPRDDDSECEFCWDK